jgi:hypothetical protein
LLSGSLAARRLPDPGRLLVAMLEKLLCYLNLPHIFADGPKYRSFWRLAGDEKSPRTDEFRSRGLSWPLGGQPLGS